MHLLQTVLGSYSFKCDGSHSKPISIDLLSFEEEASVWAALDDVLPATSPKQLLGCAHTLHIAPSRARSVCVCCSLLKQEVLCYKEWGKTSDAN